MQVFFFQHWSHPNIVKLQQTNNDLLYMLVWKDVYV